MKKRALRLDKEVLTSPRAQQDFDGGATRFTGWVCFGCDYVLTRIIDASIDSLGSDCCGGGGGSGTCSCPAQSCTCGLSDVPGGPSCEPGCN